MDFTSISKTLDRLIPDGIAHNPGDKIINRIRARILLSLYVSSGCLLIAALTIFGALHLLGHHNFSTEIILTLIMITITAAQVVMFFSAANVGASAIIYSMAYFGSTLALVIGTGGWDSPAKLLFFCSPLISFIIGGHQEGFYITFLVLVVSAILMLANKMNFQLFYLIPAENIAMVEQIVWIIAINLLASCLAIYDAILLDFSKQVRWNKR